METPEREDIEGGDDQGTSPEEPTHEATTPPGNPDVDEESAREGEENLGQAGGGH